MSANGGALNFTLGLQANQFLNSLNVASGKLVGFIGVANGIQMAFGKMWDSIQQGGKLSDLAASANLTVKELYQLQFAFEQVGAAAEAVPSVINRLRRTLGSGEQNGLLAQMGLDASQIAAADPAAQFEAIATALAKLDVNARSEAAQKLFGREGAAVAMQIANSGNDFTDAMQRAQPLAEVWGKVAKTFDAIADTVTEIIRRVQTMTAYITGALVGAIKNGKIDELLSLSFQAGMEKAMVVFDAAIKGMAQILVATLGNANLWQGIGQTIIASFVNVGTSLMDVLFRPLADLMGDLEGFDQRQLDRREYADKQMRDAAANLAIGAVVAGPQIMQAVREAWANAGKSGEAQKALTEFMNGLIGGLPKDKPPGGGSPGIIDFSSASSKTTRPDVTALEKIGLVIGRGGVSSDYARQTADATRQSAASLKTIERKLLTNEPQNFFNHVA